MTFRPRFISLFALIALCAFAAFAKSPAELVRDAVSDDSAARSAAVSELRSIGPAGLETLAGAFSAEIRRFAESGDGGPEWNRIALALDSVAMQKDAYASRLFWYTDIDAALAEAKRTNRPVLSLRMLGNLNEEFSCANSRFFRALLYSNGQISQYLRENYVLHWRSVRPVPKVTIDFGDGRKLERTLAGNSIHYILSPDGEIIDALAGLYEPDAFLGYLKRGAEMSARLKALSAVQRFAALSEFRRVLFGELRARRERAVAAAKIQLKEAAPNSTRAVEIGPLAVTKMATEAPILRDLDDNFSRFEPQIPAGDWTKLAAINTPKIGFDTAAIAFVRRQNRELDETRFARMMANLRSLVALDTTRNEFLFHTQLLGRLDRDRKPDLEVFNSRVYAELFRTPDSDRWLGMYTDEVYTGLDGNGIR